MRKLRQFLISIIICVLLVINEVPILEAHSTGGYSGGGRNSIPVVVSLGDSYSAGEGIEPYYDQDADDKYTSEDWIAHRSTLAWPGLLEFNGVALNKVKATNLTVSDGLHTTSGQEGGVWYFAAVSGAVCDNIVPYGESNDMRQTKTVAHTDKEYSLNYQIETITSMEEPSEVDYVTLTIGGNDAGFVEILTQAVKHSSLIDMSGTSLLERILNQLETFWTTTDGSVPLADKLENTYIKILQAAPSATLIVAGYPQLVYLDVEKYNSVQLFTITYEEAYVIDSAVKIFDSYIEEIVKWRMDGYDTVYVDVQDAFKGHEAGSSEEYINDLILLFQTKENIDEDIISSASFHPNEAGAQVYAEEVQKVINTLEEEKANQKTADSTAEEIDAFDYYEQALQLLETLDSFSMDIDIEMNINVKQGTTSAKATTVFDATCQLDNYGTDEFVMTGSVTLTGGGLDYAYDMSYENGVAYYNYTKPTETSVSYIMSFDLMPFESLDESAVTNAEVVSTQDDEIVIEITIDGDAAISSGAQLFPDLIQQSDISCGEIKMTVVIDSESGYLKSITMDYYTSMTINGYSATSDNIAEYTFTITEDIDNKLSSSGSNTVQEEQTVMSNVDIPEDALVWNGHYYYIYKNECSTWEDAKAYCESLGGYLAVISSEEENSVLFEYMLDCGYEAAYFGYTDSEEEGVWKWVYDEGASYVNWGNGEPNSENSNEDYASFYNHKYKDGSWNDGDFHHKTGNDDSAFICEWS